MFCRHFFNALFQLFGIILHLFVAVLHVVMVMIQRCLAFVGVIFKVVASVSFCSLDTEALDHVSGAQSCMFEFGYYP